MNKDTPKAPLTPPNYEPQRHPDYQEDEIDLRELFGIIWQGKWWIIAITFVFAVGSVIYSLSLPNIYKSEATLAPTEEASGGGLSQMAVLSLTTSCITRTPKNGSEKSSHLNSRNRLAGST